MISSPFNFYFYGVDNMHFVNLPEYYTTQMQHSTRVIYTRVCEWAMPSLHAFGLVLNCFPT